MGAPLDVIRKALDRANESASNLPERPIVERRQRRQQPLPDDNKERTQYDYVATRSVKPEEDVLRGNRIVAPFRNDARSTAFHMLRAQILKKLRDHHWRSIAVTSSKTGEGKSVLATNLAISISMEFNQTVLLVDADLRQPRIGNLLGIESERGLGDYLNQNVPVQDILINPGMERLVVLPSTGKYANASELLSGPRMQRLAEELKVRYSDRIIIYDLPPLLAGDDAMVCLPYADSVLMVVGEGQSTEEEILQSQHLLEDYNLLGVVLNKSTDSPPKYGYSS